MTVDSFPAPQLPKAGANVVLTLQRTNPYQLQPLEFFSLEI